MKKLYITLCTLSALVAGINLQAMEPGAKSVDAPKTVENTSEQQTAEMHERAKQQSTNKSKQAADARNQQKFGTTDTTSTVDLKTPDKLSPTSSTVDLKTPETTDTNVNLTSGDNSTTSTPSQGIALTEVTPDAQSTEQNVNEPLSNNEPSDVFNTARDSTESFITVDFNNEGVPAEVVDEAKNVTDKSSLSKFIETLSKLFFRENSDNPEVQDAIRASIADAESHQWWSPWDGSKFQTWYDNTMESFRKVKESLPTVSLFSSPNYVEKLNKAFNKETQSKSSTKRTNLNNAVNDVLSGFTNVNLNEE